MLHDHACRPVELREEQARRGEVAEVVERQLLPLQLLDEREQVRPRAALGVVRGGLMRVLAVRQLASGRRRGRTSRGTRRRAGTSARSTPRTPPSGRTPRRRAAGEARGRRAVVRPAARRAPRRSPAVASRPSPRRSSSPRPEERRAAHVDHLDQPRLVQLRPVDGELERIEVHADEVERLDAVLLDRAQVLGRVAAGEDSGVNAWGSVFTRPASISGKPVSSSTS